MSQRISAILACFVVLVLFLLMFQDVTGEESGSADSNQTSTASSDEPGVQFEDDFSYAAGAQQIQVDGADPVVEGHVHANMFTFARLPRHARGHLKLIMTEDNTVEGPDGEPGVLRMEIAEVPRPIRVLGFVLQGNETSGEIRMPGWERGKITMNDLRRSFITFRFRAENREDPNVVGATFRLGFAPGVAQSDLSSADFGSLIATRRWRTFRRPLASAENLTSFLEAVNGENPEAFRLVWSQVDQLSNYRPGDSLLIDDLKLSIE